jgi:hypothetical protein
LTWGRRELITACLKEPYEALYAQAAAMTLEHLHDLFVDLLRGRDWSEVVSLEADMDRQRTCDSSMLRTFTSTAR